LQRRQGRKRIQNGEVSLDVAVDILGQIVGELNQMCLELITLRGPTTVPLKPSPA
jgi:hypothetical protein